MNRESSRSHSVFTCVIESRWEKDSTTNLRFARLNLVDLAGSERQDIFPSLLIYIYLQMHLLCIIPLTYLLSVIGRKLLVLRVSA